MCFRLCILFRVQLRCVLLYFKFCLHIFVVSLLSCLICLVVLFIVFRFIIFIITSSFSIGSLPIYLGPLKAQFKALCCCSKVTHFQPFKGPFPTVLRAIVTAQISAQCTMQSGLVPADLLLWSHLCEARQPAVTFLWPLPHDRILIFCMHIA